MATSTDVAIIGGGAIGSAVAYFLLSDPAFNGRVTVIERDPSYKRASSALSASSIRQQFSTPENIRMSRFGFAFLSEIGRHLAVDADPVDIGLRTGGYLYLATPEHEAVLRENHAILRHAGVALGKVGPLHPATVARILARPWVAHALAWAFYPSLRGTYCSMAADLPHGPTEVENYNGHLIALAGDLPCPLNRAARALVLRIVAERLTPHPDLLAPLWKIQAAAESGGANPPPPRLAG